MRDEPGALVTNVCSWYIADMATGFVDVWL
jgi:hypothetical protein